MSATSSQPGAKRVLLSGVFGPFGVDDEYGRKENIMELFHNQVTREQGLASFRFHHRSFGLYFLAENIDAEVTVLDFPSRSRFVAEVAKGIYDIVGISFIAVNHLKAKEMARTVREQAPQAEIILGGHGAAIEGVEKLIECDHVCKGEGIRWLRAHLGQDPDAPIRHPALASTDRYSIFGVPLPGTTASLLVPGVGCVNGCSFCCTSHFFGKQYTAFLETGDELFETACRIADERGTDAFFIMDENFLKNRERALRLLALMEQHQRFFRFHIFSSAEAITAFGVDNMLRLGVTMAWIGFESQSRQSAFAKNVGIDTRALVQDLRDRGISVLASGILCMEHHTPENMQADIDFLCGLESDFVQFMLLTGLPVTALYADHKRRGLLRDDVPMEEWHGQTRLNYKHEAFGPGEPAEWMRKAFRQDHTQNSSSMYRVAETSLRGYEHLAALPKRDACLQARLQQFEQQAREYCLMMPAIARNAVNAQERRRALELDARALRRFGRTTQEKLFTLGARALVARWKYRLALFGDKIQHDTIVTRYPAGRELLTAPLRRARRDAEPAARLRLPPAAAAAIALD